MTTITYTHTAPGAKEPRVVVTTEYAVGVDVGRMSREELKAEFTRRLPCCGKGEADVVDQSAPR